MKPLQVNPQDNKRGTWVQIDRSAHQAWAKLALSNPTASALMHCIIGNMGSQNALVISHKLLAKMIGKSVPTIKRALEHLENKNWIQSVKIGKGKECAYIVNCRVAWSEKRDKLRYAQFSAQVLVDYEDQDLEKLDFDRETGELRQIPILYPNDIPYPVGEDEPPPQQLAFEGLEQEMPTLRIRGTDNDF